MVHRSIRWRPPNSRWLKLNTDGAVVQAQCQAGCEGIFQDEDGRYFLTYAGHLGVCIVLQAELWAIWHGIRLACERGFRQVTVETDSLVVHKLLTSGWSSLHPSFALVQHILVVSYQGVSVCWSHTLREANQVADAIEKFGLSLNVDCHIFDFVPRFISLPLVVDMSSISFPRGF